MTPQELEKLDRSLVEEGKELSKQLGELAPDNPADGSGVKVPEYGSDQYDTALEESALERNFALKQELGDRLHKIAEAREKIKKGTYGTCSDCSADIPEKRLKGLPTAILCLSCAKKSP